jgi:thiol-disulfide isomerase/thioredoxin
MEKKYLLTMFAVFTICSYIIAASAQDKKPILYFFYGRECPHCRKIEPEINKLGSQFKGLRVEKYEIWYNLSSRNKFIAMAAERGKKAEGVPTVIIGNDMYLGTDIKRVRVLINKYYQKR